MEAEKEAGAKSSQGVVVMATVKGDVHDIGKNIVGVVLGCNNYEVVDLGVMVPAEQILRAAVEKQADMIGLSGLITPSLDEMVYVAKEMERRGMDLPLLIGGATTSRQHTAVKIAPNYGQPIVHVHDASRAVGVVASLLDEEGRAKLDASNRADQEELRELHLGRREKPLLAHADAVANRSPITWREEDVAVPSFTGLRVVDDVTLDRIAEYIDWTYFFSAWELRGRFPQILDDPKIGEAARELYDAGRALLDRIVADGSLEARGVFGFWPANAVGDDIVLWSDETRSDEHARFPMLRQQSVIADGRPNRSLADFVAPHDSGLADWIGAFCVTAGIGADELAARYEAEHDDYSAIMVKALADRLAEAFAELLHERARREWGFGDDGLSNEDLIAERFRGIRPAFGYPACPDHSPKRDLFRVLDAPSIGVTLTESCAMVPAASVSGLYLAHPEARYFNLGRIGRDQVSEYAARRGQDLAEVERWLRPSLAYDPDEG